MIQNLIELISGLESFKLKLIIESIKSMNDINQGFIGDCWFLASLSSLGTNAIIIYLAIKIHSNRSKMRVYLSSVSGTCKFRYPKATK